MAERKVEPVEETVEDAPASPQTKNNQPTSPSIEPQTCAPISSSQVQENTENTSSVRIAVLDEVVAHQRQRISQLERQVDKKKETFLRLSTSSPFIPPPGLAPHAPPPTIPPASAAPASSAVRPSQPQQTTMSAAGDPAKPTQQRKEPSQPLPHNPAVAATMAAMAAASTRSVSPALHPQYPFFPFPHPETPIVAHPFMGIVPPVPPHPTPPPVQPPSSAPTSQPNQSAEEGGNRQSRYWTPDEHQRYLVGVSTFGPKNYQQIAEVVGTRNAKQVRTHSQKFQKKLEREEARRRGDQRTLSDVNSPVQTDTAVGAVLSDGTPASAPSQLRQSEVNRATDSSRNLSEAPQSAKSAEGSSSANNVSSEKNTDSSIDTVHANAKAAAAAAVAAEAAALGYGRLPPKPNTIQNKNQTSSSPTSGSQPKTRRPREAKIAKANGNRISPVPNGDTSTNPERALQQRNHVTSQAVIRPSTRTTVPAPRLESKVAATMPAGRGAESHQVTKQMFGHKLHDSTEAIAPSRRQSQSSGSVDGARSRAGPEKQPVPKVVQTAVKIEPRIVAPTPNSGPLSFCPTLATTSHSRLTILPASIPSKLEVKTVNVKTSRNTAEQSAQPAQKPAVGNRNTRPETEIRGNGSVSAKKQIPALPHRQNEVIPNGQQGTRTLQNVPNRGNANRLSPPAESKKHVESASVPTTNSVAVGHVSDHRETSGNDETLDKSHGISSANTKATGNQDQRDSPENSQKVRLIREAPNISDQTGGMAVKDTPAVQKENESGEPPDVSKSWSMDDVSQAEQKCGGVQTGSMDTSGGQVRDKCVPKRPTEQATCSPVDGSGHSLKGERWMRCNGQSEETSRKRSDNDTSHDEVVPKKHRQADQVIRASGQTIERQQDKPATETQVQKQNHNSASSVGEAAGGQEAIKKCVAAGGDTGEKGGEIKEAEKEGKAGLTGDIPNGQVDESAKGGSNEKPVEQETKMDIRDEGVGKRDEKADMKRGLDKAMESVAKRQKGNDESSRIVGEIETK